jgi:uncharacterized protein
VATSRRRFSKAATTTQGIKNDRRWWERDYHSSQHSQGSVMFFQSTHIPMLFVMLASLAGCQKVKGLLPTASWHEKHNWKAEKYFADPQVIALCRAIEANDLAEMDRLIAAGADVNAQGKGKMTPLLWALPDNKLGRFERLLQNGANPNVIIESDFGTRGFMMPGTAVTHMASRTVFPGYFEAVFASGGDPNCEQKTKTLGAGDTPIFTVIVSPVANKKQKIKLLLDKGADINHVNASEETPAKLAVEFGQFDIVLMLLELGADHMVFTGSGNQRLVHVLLIVKANIDAVGGWTPQQRTDFEAICQWLETHGESISKADQDLKRWGSWSKDNGEYKRKMDAEVAARKANRQRVNHLHGLPPASRPAG